MPRSQLLRRLSHFLVLVAVLCGAATSFGAGTAGTLWYRSSPDGGRLPTMRVDAPAAVTVQVTPDVAVAVLLELVRRDGTIAHAVDFGPIAGRTTVETEANLEAGTYQIRINGGQVGGRGVRISTTASKFVIPSGTRFYGYGAEPGSVFTFFVPSSVTEFALRTTSYPARMSTPPYENLAWAHSRVTDPDGTVEAEMYGSVTVRPAAADRFWQLQLTCEYECMVDLGGVPYWLAESEEAWFDADGGSFARFSAADDIQADGRADLFWHHALAGQNGFWLMDGGHPTGSAFTHGSDPAWEVKASGDLDGDGNVDLIFQHAAGDRSAVWFLAGSVPSGSAFLPVHTSGFAIRGCADFDRDGFDDLVWADAAGATEIWRMRGATRLGVINVGPINPEWRVVAAADMNRDGFADLLLHNATTGQNGVWFMRFGVYSSGQLIPGAASEWELSAAGDFDGDGATDLAWRNISDGRNAIWFMDGAYVRDTVFIDGAADLNWMIVGPR